MPMYELLKSGSIDSAFLYWTIDSSNRPVRISSSA